MPKSKPTPEDWPSDDLVLAAIDRASRHRGTGDPGETLAKIKRHLDLPHHSGPTAASARSSKPSKPPA
jgi:hypothetical protein